MRKVEDLDKLLDSTNMTLYMDYLSDKERVTIARRHLIFSYDGIRIFVVEDDLFNDEKI